MNSRTGDESTGLLLLERVRPLAVPTRAPRRPGLEKSMTADEFEQLDAWQAELWIARRFHQLMSDGYTPSQALLLAVRPEVDVPIAVASISDPNPAVRAF